MAGTGGGSGRRSADRCADHARPNWGHDEVAVEALMMAKTIRPERFSILDGGLTDESATALVRMLVWGVGAAWLERKSKVTLIGTMLARPGLEFIYEGELPACDQCKVRKACNNLRVGAGNTGFSPSGPRCTAAVCI